jgi:CheY-like chemotaxis protein
MQVVIIEADAAVGQATEMLLEIDGHNVWRVSSAREARALVVARGAPDAIVCDFYAPRGRTAIEAIEALRAGAGREIPAVVISSDTSSFAASFAAAAAGEAALRPFHLLRKPFYANDLSELMRRLRDQRETPSLPS